MFMLLLSFAINGMQKAPNEIFSISALPSDVQNLIGSYLQEKEGDLMRRIWDPIYLPSEKGIRNFFNALKAQGITFDQLRLGYALDSEDETKLLFKYIENNGSTFGLYHKKTDQYKRLVWISFNHWEPAAISNNGLIYILRSKVANHFKVIDIYVVGAPKIKHLYFEKDIEKIYFNRNGTQFAVRFTDSSVKLFSRKVKIPQQDPNSSENLLGRYFREIGVCKTLSKQNPHLSK